MLRGCGHLQWHGRHRTELGGGGATVRYHPIRGGARLRLLAWDTLHGRNSTPGDRRVLLGGKIHLGGGQGDRVCGDAPLHGGLARGEGVGGTHLWMVGRGVHVVGLVQGGRGVGRGVHSSHSLVAGWVVHGWVWHPCLHMHVRLRLVHGHPRFGNHTWHHGVTLSVAGVTHTRMHGHPWIHTAHSHHGIHPRLRPGHHLLVHGHGLLDVRASDHVLHHCPRTQGHHPLLLCHHASLLHHSRDHVCV